MRDGLTIRCNWSRWFATKVASNEVNNGESNRDSFQDTPCAVACRSRSLLLHSEPHGKSWRWIKIHKTYLDRIRIRIGHCCVRHGSRGKKGDDEEVDHPFLLFSSFASQGGQHLTFTFGALFFIVPPPQTYILSWFNHVTKKEH